MEMFQLSAAQGYPEALNKLGIKVAERGEGKGTNTVQQVGI
jgi:hypothetical protein